MFANLIADVRYALRGLLSRPGFTMVVVLTLALGIGANAGIFSIFHQILLRPLPVPQPDELVLLSEPGPKQGNTSTGNEGRDEQVFSWPMWRDLQATPEAQAMFTGIAAHRSFGASLALDGQTRGGDSAMVSGEYFTVLGVQPFLGRLFTPDDADVPGEDRVVVLGHAYWQNELGGDQAAIGKLLTVNGERLEIIGVAPPGFDGVGRGRTPLVYVPISMARLAEPGRDPGFENRRNHWIYLFARLREGMTSEQASVALNGPFQRLVREVEAPLQTGVSEAWMQRFMDKSLRLLPGDRGQSIMLIAARQPLTLLMAVTLLVLLVACVNVANLLLARGASRSGELAMRSALGASGVRIVVQVLSEAMVLALFGGVAGLFVAWLTLKGIIALSPASEMGFLSAQLNAATVAYSLVIALFTALLFGVMPAWQAWRAAPIEAIRGQSGRGISGRAATGFRNGLATVQIAFSMALLVVAGLLIQSLANISRLDLGMQVERVATFRISPERSGYDLERTRALYAALEERLAAMPGVVSASASVVPLLTDSNWDSNMSVQGFDAGADTDTNAKFNIVGPGFNRALSIPMLAGRDFSTADDQGRPRVAIVNQAFARKFAMGDDVVGKRMALGTGGELDIEIVGLVADAKYSQVKDEIPPQFFLPWRQRPSGIGSIGFYLRTGGDVEPVLAAIPRVVAELDPNLPVSQIAALPMVVQENVFVDRLIGTLAAAFAMLATVLAAIGLYGVLSFTLAQRTRELGLRLALGAAPAALRKLVFATVARMALSGAALGLIAALALGSMAQALLFGVGAFEPLVMLGATLALASVVVLAGWLPARRAARTDPMIALRDQ